MQTAKPKQYGSGPHGYFQRMLMDGAKPFHFQPQIGHLLGRPPAASVRALNADRITALNFPRHLAQPWDLPDDAQHVDQPIKPADIPAQDFLPLHDEKERIEGKHSTSQQLLADHSPVSERASDDSVQPQENITILSWLERMQARQPSIEPVQQIEERSEQELMVSPREDIKPTAVAPVPTQSKQKVDDNTEISATVVSSGNRVASIDLPDGPRSSVGASSQVDDASISRGHHHSTKQSGVLKPEEQLIPTAAPVTMTSIQNAKVWKREQSTRESPRHTGHHPIETGLEGQAQSDFLHKPANPFPVETNNGADSTIKAPVAMSQPLITPTVVSQHTSTTKLQVALQQRRKTASTDSERSFSRQSTDTDIPRTPSSQPQVQQHITVLNPTVGTSQSAAYWERKYLCRSGPRSYK